MYLRTGLFHEALFEIVPGDEGHKLGEERHTLTPCLPPKRPSFPSELGSPTKGEVCNGEGCVHMVIFGMDATLTFRQSPTTAPQMSAELINIINLALNYYFFYITITTKAELDSN